MPGKDNNQRVFSAAPAAVLLLLLFFVVFPDDALCLKPGDIVFADSGGIWTGIGYSRMKKQFGVGVGHTGIYVGKEDGVDRVVHCAVWGGVVETSLETFPGYGKYKGARTAYPPLTPEQRKKMVEFARSQIGSDHNYFPWKKKQREYYNCTGFTETVYEHVGLDPTPWWAGDLPHRFIWPLEQYNSPNLQDAVTLAGPIISGPGEMFMRLWMTYGYTFIWLCLVIILLSFRRRYKAAKLRKQNPVQPASTRN